jgi:hypothetical protein
MLRSNPAASITVWRSQGCQEQREREDVGFGVDTSDDRLHQMAIVSGVVAGEETVAYPVPAIGGLLEDSVGGTPVLLVRLPADGGVRAFDRQVGGRALSFERTGDGLVSGDETRWDALGKGLEGPLAGERLERLDTHGMYWFALRRRHPNTAVYGAR